MNKKSSNNLNKKIITFGLSLILLTSIFTSMPLVISDPSEPWWDSNWQYQKEIVINYTMVDGNLVNFPILIYNSSDSDLAAYAQDSGDDIVFTNSEGVKLNHEIELFNGTSGELVAWVNVTSLSSVEDTVLYIYYGNSECSSQENSVNVWDSNYLSVYHLNENPGSAGNKEYL